MVPAILPDTTSYKPHKNHSVEDDAATEEVEQQQEGRSRPNIKPPLTNLPFVNLELEFASHFAKSAELWANVWRVYDDDDRFLKGQICPSR